MKVFLRQFPEMKRVPDFTILTVLSKRVYYKLADPPSLYPIGHAQMWRVLFY